MLLLEYSQCSSIQRGTILDNMKNRIEFIQALLTLLY